VSASAQVHLYRRHHVQVSSRHCNNRKISDVFTFSALVPGDRIRADPELSKFLGSVVGSLDPPVARRIFLMTVLQAQYVWFGNGCAGMMFEAVSKSQLKIRALANSILQGNDNDMGIHLYVPDEQDRGTNWNCTVEEMLEYAAAAEPQQVSSPVSCDFLF